MLKRLLKDTAIYGSGDFILKVIAFAVFPVYAHIFTVAEFGIMELVMTFAGLIGILLNMGMNNSVQRYYWDKNIIQSSKPKLVSTGFFILLFWSLLLTIIVIIILYPLRIYIEGKYSILWIFILIALTNNIFLQILQYCLDVTRLHFSPFKFVFISGLKNLLGIIFGLFIILYLKKGLIGYFLGPFFAAILSFPVGLLSIKKDLCFKYDKKYAKQLISFGYPFIFVGLAYWIFGSMDRWMLGILSNNINVGLYSIAFKFAIVVTFIISAFSQAWSPVVIKVYLEDPDYKRKISDVFTKWFFFLTIVGVLISIFGLELLRLTTPKEYWAAANILSIVVMGVVIYGTSQVTAIGISIEKKTYLFTHASWITAIVNLGLNFLLIPKFGAIGAGVATFFSYFLLTGLYFYWTQRLHPFPFEKTKIMYIVLVILSTIIFILFINNLVWGIKIVIYKFIYFITFLCLSIFIVKIVNKDDVRSLLTQLKFIK